MREWTGRGQNNLPKVLADSKGRSWNSIPGQLLGFKASCFAQTVECNGEERDKAKKEGQGWLSVSLHCLGILHSAIRRPRGTGYFHKGSEKMQVNGSSLHGKLRFERRISIASKFQRAGLSYGHCHWLSMRSCSLNGSMTVYPFHPHRVTVSHTHTK